LITPYEIVAAVCAKTQLHQDYFWHVRGQTSYRYGRQMSATIGRVRMVAAWLMRVMRGMSLPEIAKVIGLASHRDVHRLLRLLPEQEGLVDMCTDLWFELQRVDEPVRPRGTEPIALALLQQKVAAFERDVGLHLHR
jgi:hypothetical protein